MKMLLVAVALTLAACGNSEPELDRARDSSEDLSQEVATLRNQVEDLREERNAAEEKLSAAQKKLRKFQSDTAGLSARVQEITCLGNSWWCDGANVRVVFSNHSPRGAAISCAFEVELDDGSSVYFTGQIDYVAAGEEATSVVTWYGERGLRSENIYVRNSKACERWSDI